MFIFWIFFALVIFCAGFLIGACTVGLFMGGSHKEPVDRRSEVPLDF